MYNLTTKETCLERIQWYRMIHGILLIVVAIAAGVLSFTMGGRLDWRMSAIVIAMALLGVYRMSQAFRK